MSTVFNKIKREIAYFSKSFKENSIGAYSAQAAFFIITSFFPFMMLTVSLIRFTPLSISNLEQLISQGTISVPAGDLITSLINEVTLKAASGAFIGVAGVSAIWAASRCMLSIIQGLNKVYSVPSKRSFLRLRLISVVYILAFEVIIIVSLGLMVFGEQLNHILMLKSAAINVRWVIAVVLLTLFFDLVYTIIPERKTRFIDELPGAALSAAGWMAFSMGFSIYINNFSNYGAVYGSLAAAVIMMLWLYFCMFILFAGAQVNVWLKNGKTEKCEKIEKVEKLEKLEKKRISAKIVSK